MIRVEHIGLIPLVHRLPWTDRLIDLKDGQYHALREGLPTLCAVVRTHDLSRAAYVLCCMG